MIGVWWRFGEVAIWILRQRMCIVEIGGGVAIWFLGSPEFVWVCFVGLIEMVGWA
jgi:hypothetical protein